MIGPPDTPWAGGFFKLKVTLPEEYPLLPPKVKLLTKTLHPNVNSSNEPHSFCSHCSGRYWDPRHTIRDYLLKFYNHLVCPDFDEMRCCSDEVALSVTQDYDAFKQRAREWTQLYATKE